MSNTLLRHTCTTLPIILSIGMGTVARAQLPLPAPIPSGEGLTQAQLALFRMVVNEEGLELEGVEQRLLDPNSLFSNTGFESIDVFFIEEGTNLRSSLLVSANSGPLQTVFGDVASPDSIVPEADGPLGLGDGVRLGPTSGPTSLEFFIDTNGVTPGGNVYGADPVENPDGLQHLVVEEFTIDGESLLLVGFEDSFGPLGATNPPNENSDRDFNDGVFAIRLSENERTIVPEPTLMLALLGVAVFGAQGISRTPSSCSANANFWNQPQSGCGRSRKKV